MTEPTWALEICRKLVDLEDRLKRNSLQILGFKEDSRESWEEYENNVYDLLEEIFKMEKSNMTLERAQRVGEKSNDKEGSSFRFIKIK